MLTLKYKKPTKSEYGHTDIYIDNKYVGYMLPNRSECRTLGKNWYFLSTTKGELTAETRKELLQKIENLYSHS